MFLKKLVENNMKEVALKYLNTCVLKHIQDTSTANMVRLWPVLESTIFLVSYDPSLPIEQRPYQFTGSGKRSLCLLIKCLVAFPNEANDPFNKFADAFVTHVNNKKNESLEYFVSALTSDPQAEALKQCPQVRRILEGRKNWLKEKCKYKPTLTWEMPAAGLTKCAQVVRFLKGYEQKKEFNFKSPTDLMLFIDNFNRSGLNRENGYSAVLEKKSEQCVVITKTRALFDKKMDNYVKHLLELNVILEYFCS